MTEDNNSNNQELINTQRMIIEQLDYLRKEIENKNSQVEKFKYIINSIKLLKKEDESKTNYSQFSDGILIKTRIEKTDEFLVNVGSNIFVKKSKEKLIESLNEMLENSSNDLKRLEDKYLELIEKFNQINKE